MGRDGQVRKRYAPTVEPAKIRADIVDALAAYAWTPRPHHAAGFIDSPLALQVAKDGRLFTFCSEPCQWVWEETPSATARVMALILRRRPWRSASAS